MDNALLVLISFVAGLPFTLAYYSQSDRSLFSLLCCSVLGVATIYVIGAVLWVVGFRVEVTL